MTDMMKIAIEIENEAAQRLMQVKENPQMAYVLTMAERIKSYIENAMIIPQFEIDAYNEAVVRSQRGKGGNNDAGA